MIKNKGYRIIEKPNVESYTKGEYVRLGERLRTYNLQSEIPIEDIEMLQTLRISYKEPLSEIFGILQRAIQKINPHCSYSKQKYL